jgi:hypothetical protein
MKEDRRYAFQVVVNSETMTSRYASTVLILGSALDLYGYGYSSGRTVGTL